jgi:hypothetical protein
MKRVLSLLVLITLLAISPALTALAQDGGNPLCNGLSEADCQILVDSEAAMAGLTSFSAPKLSLSFSLTSEGETQTFDATGSGQFTMGGSPEETAIHLILDEIKTTGPDGDQSASAEIIVIGSMAYVYYNDEWYGGDASETDLSSLTDLTGMMGGAGGVTGELSGLGDPTKLMTTVRGDDVTLHDQQVAVFTTSIDIMELLSGLFTSPMAGELLGQLGGDSMEGMEGLSDMTPEQMGMIITMMAPMMEGTSITVTQGVGLDDNLEHLTQMDIVFNLDLSALSPDTKPIALELHFMMEMADHNQTFEITAPENYKPMSELKLEMPGM